MSYPPPPGTPEENNPYAPQPDPYAAQTPVPPPPAYPPQPYGQYAAPAAPGGTNNLALISMISGIVSILLACCCSPLGILGGGAAVTLGFVSQKQIAQMGQSNRGMATAGIATGAVAVVLGIGWLIFRIATSAGNIFYNFNFN